MSRSRPRPTEAASDAEIRPLDDAEAFERRGERSPALAAESLLATVAGRGRVPHEVPAAASPAEAWALLQTVQQALQAHGRVEELEAEEVAPELRAPEDEERRYYGYEIDDEMAAWIAALSKQARPTCLRSRPNRARAHCWRGHAGWPSNRGPLDEHRDAILARVR